MGLVLQGPGTLSDWISGHPGLVEGGRPGAPCPPAASKWGPERCSSAPSFFTAQPGEARGKHVSMFYYQQRLLIRGHFDTAGM